MNNITDRCKCEKTKRYTMMKIQIASQVARGKLERQAGKVGRIEFPDGLLMIHASATHL